MEWGEKGYLEREGGVSLQKKWGDNTPATPSDLTSATSNS